MPLRPIVSRPGKSTHKLAKDLQQRLKHLVDRLPHSIHLMGRSHQSASQGQPGRVEGMEARAVACSCCWVWEVKVTTGVPADFACEKCTQLQLLTDRVRKLELELDELRIIREAEGV
eukprot:g26172.t1